MRLTERRLFANRTRLKLCWWPCQGFDTSHHAPKTRTDLLFCKPSHPICGYDEGTCCFKLTTSTQIYWQTTCLWSTSCIDDTFHGDTVDVHNSLTPFLRVQKGAGHETNTTLGTHTFTHDTHSHTTKLAALVTNGTRDCLPSWYLFQLKHSLPWTAIYHKIVYYI